MRLNELLTTTKDYEFMPVNFYHKTFDSFHKMDMHSHHYFEIMYVEQGKFNLTVKKSQKNETVTINNGQFVLINSNVIHNISITEKCKIYNLEIFPETRNSTDFPVKKCLLKSKNLVDMLSKENDYTILNDTENVLALLKNIHFAMRTSKQDTESQYLLQSLIIALIINIGRCHKNNLTNAQSIYVTKILKLINDELTANLSPQHFAKILGVSPSYLHRLFKQSTGTTITQYVNNKRIEYAKSSLINTNTPLVEIAINAGFNTRQNFCTIFKKITGVSPSTFRKKERQKEYDIPADKSELSKQKTYSL